MKEQLEDLWSTLQVRWLLLDAQQKQAMILLSLYVGYTLLDVGGAILKARVAAETKGA